MTYLECKSILSDHFNLEGTTHDLDKALMILFCYADDGIDCMHENEQIIYEELPILELVKIQQTRTANSTPE